MKAANCTVCKHREAFFFRPYSGEKLCRRCFARSIENKVRSTVAEYDMLKHNDRIAVGVSGGKDSSSLLQILSKIEHDYPKSSLVAVTIDEGIKEYRDEALKIAKENCRNLSVEHHVVSFKELYGYTFDEIIRSLKKNEVARLTPCAYCGVLRRKALNFAARHVKAHKLATAHTLDDEIQTILLNILHGDPLRIAKERPTTEKAHPKLVQRIKPFCMIPEKETTLYAYVKRLNFQDIPCPYGSEALRNDVRRFLNRMEEKHAGIKFTISKSMERIRPAAEKIVKHERFNECTICGEPTSGKTCKACQILQQTEKA